MSGETSLDAIFSGEQVERTEVAETPQDLPTDEPQDQTGVDESVTPTDEPQDDPIERHKKGLEAGIAAERTKRQAAEREAAELRAWFPDWFIYRGGSHIAIHQNARGKRIALICE